MSPVGVSNGAGPHTPPDTTASTPTPDYPGTDTQKELS